MSAPSPIAIATLLPQTTLQKSKVGYDEISKLIFSISSYRHPLPTNDSTTHCARVSGLQKIKDRYNEVSKFIFCSSFPIVIATNFGCQPKSQKTNPVWISFTNSHMVLQAIFCSYCHIFVRVCSQRSLTYWMIVDAISSSYYLHAHANGSKFCSGSHSVCDGPRTQNSQVNISVTKKQIHSRSGNSGDPDGVHFTSEKSTHLSE